MPDVENKSTIWKIGMGILFLIAYPFILIWNKIKPKQDEEE